MVKTTLTNQSPDIKELRAKKPNSSLYLVTFGADGSVNTQAEGFSGGACKEHPFAEAILNAPGVEVHDTDEACETSFTEDLQETQE